MMWEMGRAIGQILPLAVGVAISPVPIIAVILMLISARAKANGSAFVGGWVVGIASTVAVALLVGNASDASTSRGGSDTVSWIKLVLGVLLLLAAWRQLRSRPTGNNEPAMPKRMAGIDAFTPGKAFGVGALLSSLNPKNLALGLSAGASIAQTGISSGQKWGTAVIFITLASVTVALPMVYYLLGGATAARTLDSWKAWLQQNNTTVMAVLFIVFGFVLIGQSIQTLSS
jgi:threonine/homoserine/homoserine lactone efflux protein